MDEHEVGHMGLGNLPESCMSIILGLTTPRDVCRFSVVSHTFRLAGYSDSVWEKMLPIQYRHLLSRLDSPLQFSSKKELYFTLCHPQLIDCSKKKFWIERATGKLCFIVSPKRVTYKSGLCVPKRELSVHISGMTPVSRRQLNYEGRLV